MNSIEKGINVLALDSTSQEVGKQEWKNWYEAMQERLQKVKEENNNIEDDTTKRHQRYRERESTYRNTIHIYAVYLSFEF